MYPIFPQDTPRPEDDPLLRGYALPIRKAFSVAKETYMENVRDYGQDVIPPIRDLEGWIQDMTDDYSEQEMATIFPDNFSVQASISVAGKARATFTLSKADITSLPWNKRVQQQTRSKTMGRQECNGKVKTTSKAIGSTLNNYTF